MSKSSSDLDSDKESAEELTRIADTIEEENEEEEVEGEETPSEENVTQKAKTLFKHMLQIPRISSRELVRKVLKREPLFKKIYTSDSFTDVLPDWDAEEKANMLITGFGLKNLQQLREALEAEAKLKAKKTDAEMFPCVCTDESSETSESLPPPAPPEYSIEERVKYLMQLEEYIEVEGEFGTLPKIPIEEEGLFIPPIEPEPRSSMERAKKYLRDHRIFQLFQFMLSHLLSSCPEDPIDYLMNLLDRVLLYRTGLLSAPLLYEKKHIIQLFKLMDRFGQGYVDIKQYRTAMETLGICSYKKKPMLNSAGMVPQEVFVEEIFAAELAMFNDLVRNRMPCTCDLTAPPPTIIEMDLKTQTTISEGDSDIMEFNPVAPVMKFWEKHGERQPNVYKGKFWADLSREYVRRESERKDSDQKEKPVSEDDWRTHDKEQENAVEDANNQ